MNRQRKDGIQRIISKFSMENKRQMHTSTGGVFPRRRGRWVRGDGERGGGERGLRPAEAPPVLKVQACASQVVKPILSRISVTRMCRITGITE